MQICQTMAMDFAVIVNCELIHTGKIEKDNVNCTIALSKWNNGDRGFFFFFRVQHIICQHTAPIPHIISQELFYYLKKSWYVLLYFTHTHANMV